MATQCAPNIEVPEGYALADRLGAGGYGEVWKATAPGGVEKAIKVVFGHCDEELAERECKALDRIRSVRHPFLLSIERYEVVNHRLVIVTELADRSLDARFKECRAAGEQGVPRDELINYLADAAEALDCLSERYSLQHLDIKPENLLLVGDHVKVADFGLVKDIASQTLNSLIGGMTPLYSPPELYDDEPSPFSDQYSLAIVYQHMLTGEAPFSGRTPAQLAKQHMQAAPILTPLDEHDRQVVGRALSKDPAHRFVSCRQFIAALRGEVPAGAAPPAAPAPVQPTPGSSSTEETKSAASLNTAPIGDRKPLPAAPPPAALPAAAKSSARPRTSFPAVSPDVIDQAPPQGVGPAEAISTPTLVVGLGGVGGALLAAFAERAAPPGVACLAIDTDMDALKATCRAASEEALGRDDLLHTPLRRPRDYRDDSQDLLKWLSRRWLYNIPRSLTTRGFRPLGRLAMVDHAEQVLEALYVRLQRLAQGADVDPVEVQVVLLAGASGATGSGTAIDIAQAVRSVAAELGVGVRVRGVFASTFRPESQDSLAASNMYALLEELHHAQRSGNRGEATPNGPASFYERDTPPFDELRLVDLPTRNDAAARQRAIASVASLVRLESTHNAVPNTASSQSGKGVAFAHHRCLDLDGVREALVLQHNLQRVREFSRYCLKADSGLTDPAAEPFGRYANSRLAGRLLQLIEPPPEGLDAAKMSEAARLRAERLELAAASTRVLEACLRDNGADEASGQLTGEFAPAYGELLEELAEGVARHEDAEHFCGEFLRSRLPERLAERSGGGAGERVLSVVREFLAMKPPLNCGHHRVALLVGDSPSTDALAQAAPLAGPLPAPGAGDQLLLLGSGITPLQLGARLAESFADIEDAASRLHARDDIEWPGLR
ncbi:Tubulin-like protein [Posidoniimonas corsicana]|uniref:Tubulin-like protein n=1 Tax=Posidoniimonas corsicana TaxID=1938618 RepID=A0A5C5VEQ0_9BACT|nr:tubulin-like doman-containing protein [Posidoniimonas corsicana]TWT37116.1 Tubulin-like protein [Posidoniimonas corsicana]